MLSICLPIYNRDVTTLVKGLHQLGQELPVPVELVLMDDGSQAPWPQHHASLGALSGVRYEALPQNVGRARIRNRLAQAAQYPYLIFLDGDMSLVQSHFLRAYWQLAQDGISVACGGHVYDSNPPGADRLLHWRYGMTRETPPLAERLTHPHQSFKTSNFLVQREIMLRIGFDERLRQYGHEDTLFGFQLAEAGIPIVHLDNPLQHDDVELNEVFLQKTELGLQNLLRIRQDFSLPAHFDDNIKLLQAVGKVQGKGVDGLLRHLFRWGKPVLRRSLLSGRAPIAWFNVYKLGYYLSLMGQP